MLCRDPDEDGPRVAVICPALGGAFFYSRDVAEDRIRKHFPALDDRQVRRGVMYLGSRARLAFAPRVPVEERSNWVHGWMQDR